MALTTTRGSAMHFPFLLIVIVALFSSNVLAFSPLRRQETWRAQSVTRQSSTTLSMILTPTGPFCPFRSSAAQKFDPRMEAAERMAPIAAAELASIQKDIEAGKIPDPDRMRSVATALEESVDHWESLVTRLRLSSDFQTREYSKILQALFEVTSRDLTEKEMTSMMRWQAGCMRAMADNTPPPMLPPELDLQKMMALADKQQSEASPPLSISSMTAAGQFAITAEPFSENSKAFESPTVRDEYDALCRDHASLIEMGTSYSEFDPSGKLVYLDKMDEIEDRWNVFLTRFKLMGLLNEEFTRQCNEFLASLGMDEEGYNKLLKKTHEIMREDAEREAMMGL